MGSDAETERFLQRDPFAGIPGIVVALFDPAPALAALGIGVTVGDPINRAAGISLLVTNRRGLLLGIVREMI